jgi:hypothetical protein
MKKRCNLQQRWRCSCKFKSRRIGSRHGGPIFEPRFFQAKKMELSSLLSKPLFGSGFSGKYLTMTGKLNLPQELNKGDAFNFFSYL